MAFTRIALFLTANASQASAEFGQFSGKILGVGQSMRTTNRQAGYMNQQFRALGTTMKYMFAGAITYGMVNMIRNLAQFQQQLGLVSSTAQLAGIHLTGNALMTLRDQILGAATDTITPVNDMTQALINYLGHVKGQPVNQIVPSLDVIAKAAKLSLTPVEDVTVAVTTMNRAFGLPVNTTNIEKLAAKWAVFTAVGPATANVGPKIIQQMGGLASAARMAHMDPGQMFAMLLANLQYGINPQQATTGLRFLFQQMATGPVTGTKEQRAAFAAMGITPDVVQQRGGFNILTDIFKKVTAQGGIQNVKRVNQGLTQGNLNPNDVPSLGLGGQGLVTLATLFKSRYALRNAIALYEFWKDGRLNNDLKTLGDSQQSYQDQLSKFKKAWQDFTSQSGLTKAAIAIQGMKLQFAEGIAGPLTTLAGIFPWLQKVMLHHKTATDIISKASAAALLTLGIGKITGAGRIFGRIPGLRSLGMDAAWRAAEVSDVTRTLGGMPQDGSPEHPFYVVILHSFDKGTSTTPKSIEKTAEDVAKEVGKGAGWLTTAWLALRNKFPTIFGKILGPIGEKLPFLGESAAKFARIGGPLAIAATAWDFFSDPGGHVSSMVDAINLNKLAAAGRLRGMPLVSALGRRLSNMNVAYGSASNRAVAALLSDPQHFKTNYPSIERALEAANKPLMKRLETQNIAGDIWLTIETIDPQGKKATARVHLPPDTFSGGRAPTTRGKPKRKHIHVKTTSAAVQGHL